MPLTQKGHEIMASMKKEYGEEAGERVFYASKQAGTISGVDAGMEGDGSPLPVILTVADLQEAYRKYWEPRNNSG